MAVRYRSLITHILGCIAFLAVPIFFSPDLSLSLRFFTITPFQRDFFSYVLLLVFFYVNYLVLLPQLYFQGKYVWFVVYLIICFAAVAGLPYLFIHDNLVADTASRVPPPGHGFWNIVRGRFPQFLIVLMFSLMVKINSRWKESEQQKLTADLSFLKAQVNPHFLFNSLNSIYSLAIERSDKTASAVVKLSGMMRYVIVDAARDHVPLERELDYINDYVEMQKIRLGSTIDFSYDVQIHTPGLTIAPLILIPFVENAFKYGVNPEEESMIRMVITTTDRNLILILENNKVVKNVDQNFSSGIGLGNARNRLKLLYPGKHDLLIKEDNNKFNVYLAVTL